MEDKALSDLLGNISSQIEALTNSTNAKFEVLAGEINGIKAAQETLSVEVSDVKKELVKTNIKIENEIGGNLKKLLDGMEGIKEKFERQDAMEETLQDVKSDVEVMWDVVKGHTTEIKGHTREIADLKAANQ